MNFEAISMEAAVALTGLSKRTLWRRLAEGLLQKLPAAGGGGAVRLVMQGVLALAGLELGAEERALLCQADAGDAAAQAEIGQFCFRAGRPAAAVYWFNLAAAQNHADAMQCLGQCYAAGTGVARDDNLALMWIAKAAAHGHRIAQRQMAGLQR